MSKINDIAFAIVTETAEAMQIAQGMVSEAQAAAKAQVEAEQYTGCRNCQAAFVNWRIANPNGCEADAENAHREAWETCPECVAEYTQWADSVEAAAEKADRSLLDLHAYNGDDHRWQNGGSK